MQRRRYIDLIRHTNRKPDGVYWHSGETYEHVLKKLEVCYYLKKQGKSFITEGIFKDNGLRCDILNLDDGYIVEIINSESQESIDVKKEKYPLPIIVINSKDVFDEKMLL